MTKFDCEFRFVNLWRKLLLTFKFKCGLLLLALVHLPVWCYGLRDVRIIIPAAVRRGDSIHFKCLYDIEADALYTVKWYRGDREFFSYTPRDDPKARVFPISGFDVGEQSSNATHVSIWNVTQGAAGRYKCEVSADAPSFHTALVSATMDVVELPNHRPIISGIKSRYRLNDVLKGNCTSKYSFPAANLTWYINGQQPKSSLVRRYHPTQHAGGLLTAVSSVQFLINSRHFLTGKLKIRCTASLYGIYWQSTEKSASEEKKRPPVSVPEVQHVALVYPVQREPDQNRENLVYSNSIFTGAVTTGEGNLSSATRAINLLYINIIVVFHTFKYYQQLR